MGFNNDGVKVVAERLKEMEESRSHDSRLTTHDSSSVATLEKIKSLPMKMPGRIMKFVLKNCILM